MSSLLKHIGLIGYGNVGSHLSHILSNTNNLKLTIYNRGNIPKDQIPASAEFTHDLAELASADLIIISVKDDAIISILEQLEDRIPQDTIVVHCSGSIPSKVISPYFDRYGVLYPLQTFSRDKKVDYSKIPVFITGSDTEVSGVISTLAGYVSNKINEISDEQRISLHIAAIFCCNYTNALYTISQKICVDHDLDFQHLLPLIEETAQKVQKLSPQNAQTGPAVRGDWEIIHEHEVYLSQYNNQINSLYRQLADYISKNI